VIPLHRLWTLIHRPKKTQTAKQKAARSAAGKKAAKTRAANRKAGSHPAPRSGKASQPKKAHTPRPATQAA